MDDPITMQYGAGRFIGLLVFCAGVFGIVAWNSWKALSEESYNAESRRLSWYGFIGGIGGVLFFGWLIYSLSNILDNR
jgi:hypothetical protein